MKKYYLKVLFLFISLSILLVSNNASANLPLAGRLIVVDAGHGGIGLIQKLRE